jgi:hypothetical protein
VVLRGIQLDSPQRGALGRVDRTRGRWTYAHRRGLRIGVVAPAALTFVFWGRPTVGVVIGIVVLLLLALGLIELIGRPPAPASPPGPPAPPGSRAETRVSAVSK